MSQQKTRWRRFEINYVAAVFFKLGVAKINTDTNYDLYIYIDTGDENSSNEKSQQEENNYKTIVSAVPML